jgi:hypothetical protein
MVNAEMEVIEEVGEIEYWRETMTQTNSLRYLGEQDADGVQTGVERMLKLGPTEFERGYSGLFKA